MGTAATRTDKPNKVTEHATVLVIDDEQSMRDACCRALGKDGYKTETAENAETGLAKARQVKPDVVLVDLKMPGMGGMELLEKIRDIDPHITAIVITGYATIESAVEAMRRHAYDFLPKPFTPGQLRTAIDRGTERRRLAIERERLLRDKQMMKENFVTLVSHQLRSPLASVKQYFGVILGGFAGDVDGRQKQMLEKAGKNIDSLLQLIDDWLDMSRIEADRIRENSGPVALKPILAEILNSAEAVATAKGVTVELRARDDLPTIQADRSSLRRAFANLVANAIDYNRPGGAVTVTTGEESSDIVVEISDKGIGISDDDLGFIFNEFFRVKSEQTRSVPGSGLGLPTAQRIIEAHNGRIRAVSELGKGSTFSVFLPKTEVKQ